MAKSPKLSPDSKIGRRVKKVSKNSRPDPKTKVKATVKDLPGECSCNDLFSGQPNGLVFWSGDELTILPFPGNNATLQYINGNPVWVNNS